MEDLLCVRTGKCSVPMTRRARKNMPSEYVSPSGRRALCWQGPAPATHTLWQVTQVGDLVIPVVTGSGLQEEEDSFVARGRGFPSWPVSKNPRENASYTLVARALPFSIRLQKLKRKPWTIHSLLARPWERDPAFYIEQRVYTFFHKSLLRQKSPPSVE